MSIADIKIGCPGAGKGTLGPKLASEWGWCHMSVGDELRSYTQESEQEEDTVARCVKRAELVPIKPLTEILCRRLQALQNQGHSSFIIDGFPRLANQISYMQDTVGREPFGNQYDFHL